MKTKKLLSLLLALALVLGLVPTAAAGAETAITSVSVTIATPAVGSYADYQPYLPNDAHYYSDNRFDDDCRQNDVIWEDVTIEDGVELLEVGDACFEADHSYRVTVDLTAQSGYAFSAATTATLNGAPAQTAMTGKQLSVSYTFVLTAEGVLISSVALSISEPEVGDAPDYDPIVQAGGHCHFSDYNESPLQNGVAWFDKTANDYLTPGTDLFRPAHKYHVWLYLEPDSGYVFDEYVSVTYNGALGTGRRVNNELESSFEFDMLPIPDYVITEATTVIQTPEAGALPSFDPIISEIDPYYVDEVHGPFSDKDVAWRDLADNSNLTEGTDRFIAGHSYQLWIYLTAKDGYQFADITTAELNGESVECQLLGDQLEITKTYGPLPEVISSAEATITVPVVGVSPDYVPWLPVDAHYHSENYHNDHFQNDVSWWDVTADRYMIIGEDVFVDGHQYRLFVNLTPNEGYEFSYSATATINGEPAEAERLEDCLQVSQVFTPLSADVAIAEASVSIPEPVAGMLPSFNPVIAETDPYYVAEVQGPFSSMDVAWRDLADNSNLTDGVDRFVEGHSYQVWVYLTAKDGHLFTGDTTAKLNGESADCRIVVDQLEITAVFGPTPASNVITEAEVIIPEPVAGALPSFDPVIALSEPYFVAQIDGPYSDTDVAWMDLDETRWLTKGTDTFIAGHVYQVWIYLTPEEGYTFADNATALLNGVPAEAGILSGQLEITAVYGPTREAVSSVEITLTNPKVGEHPDPSPVLPENVHYGFLPGSTAVWTEVGSETPLDPATAVFEHEHEYEITVLLAADEGYAFAWDVAVEVNGWPAFYWITADEAGNSVLKVSYPFIPYAGIPIDEDHFPDEVFRTYIANQFDGGEYPGYLTDAEIAAVTEIELYEQGVASLVGIEYFTALTSLDATGNSLTELNLCANTALENVSLLNNELTSLQINGLDRLRYLDVEGNDLTALDVSGNTALEYLYILSNALTSLNVSGLTALRQLDCSDNQITSLDITGNMALEQLYCDTNPLTSLILGSKATLCTLSCYDTGLTLVSIADCPILTDVFENGTVTITEDYVEYAGGTLNGLLLIDSWVAVLSVAPEFKTQSLVLADKIGVNFFMELPAIEGVDWSESYMTFTIFGIDGCTERCDYDPDFTNSKGYYGFTCYINAAQLADTITATFHYESGLTVEKTYSVKEYLNTYDEYKSSFDPKTQAMIEALADYGHYVQAFLAWQKNWTYGVEHEEMDKYYTASYDIDTIKAAAEGYAINRVNNTNGDVEKITYSVTVDSATAILVYFKPVSDYSGTLTVTLDGEDYTATAVSGRWEVRIPGISAHQLGRPFTIVATTEHGTATVTISALSYVAGGMTSYAAYPVAMDAMASIYAYAKAAEAYKN